MIDYERAVLNIIGTKCPDTEVKDCFFHISSLCVWRHVQELGCQRNYKMITSFLYEF